MSTTTNTIQQQTHGQYTVGKPKSKRLTIIDTMQSPPDVWELQSFFCKEVKKVKGSNRDTRKIKVSVTNSSWDRAKIPPLQPQQLWGKDVVFTHRKVNYKTYSGHIDDVDEKNMKRILKLHATDVNDQTP